MALISNVGTSLPAVPSIRIRHSIVTPDNGPPFTKETTYRLSRPDIVAQFFDHAHKVDVNDHIRQGLLAVERLWHTNNWVIRIFSTILGIIVVNAYLLYVADLRSVEGATPDSFYRFVDSLIGATQPNHLVRRQQLEVQQ